MTCVSRHGARVGPSPACSTCQPERAMEVYEAALRGSPSDPAPATKIGQALVNTHHYGKVIAFHTCL